MGQDRMRSFRYVLTVILGAATLALAGGLESTAGPPGRVHPSKGVRSTSPHSTDWPCWRGPHANGVADGRHLPIRWSPTENIRWSVELPGWGTSSPVVFENRVFVTSEVEENGAVSLLTLCFDRQDGKELWRHDRGLLYALMDNGLLVCLDGETGKEHYRRRLRGACNSSPVASDGHIYVNNNEGTTFVVRAGKEFELLSTNRLGERITASPALSGDALIYRTDSHLYCVGGARDSEPAPE